MTQNCIARSDDLILVVMSYVHTVCSTSRCWLQYAAVPTCFQQCNNRWLWQLWWGEWLWWSSLCWRGRAVDTAGGEIHVLELVSLWLSGRGCMTLQQYIEPPFHVPGKKDERIKWLISIVCTCMCSSPSFSMELGEVLKSFRCYCKSVNFICQKDTWHWACFVGEQWGIGETLSSLHARIVHMFIHSTCNYVKDSKPLRPENPSTAKSHLQSSFVA